MAPALSASERLQARPSHPQGTIMEPMQWLTLAIFAITILAVVTNIIDSTLAALIGVR